MKIIYLRHFSPVHVDEVVCSLWNLMKLRKILYSITWANTPLEEDGQIYSLQQQEGPKIKKPLAKSCNGHALPMAQMRINKKPSATDKRFIVWFFTHKLFGWWRERKSLAPDSLEALFTRYDVQGQNAHQTNWTGPWRRNALATLFIWKLIYYFS